MALAVMLSTDEDSFICDMAETYHVLDYKALPVKLLATLASGLRENSRVKMKLAGAKYLPPEMIIPHVADNLAIIRGMLAGDKKKPSLLAELLFSKETEKPKGFQTGEDFDAAWNKFIGDRNG